MPYVTSIERLAREEGLLEGLRQGVEQGVQQGMQQGMQQGVQQGMQQGVQQGMQQGKVQNAQEAVLEVLQARFGDVPYGLREHLLEVQDPAKLKGLLRRAILVDNLETFRKEF